MKGLMSVESSSILENTFSNESLESKFNDFLIEEKEKDDELDVQDAKIAFLNKALLDDGSESDVFDESVYNTIFASKGTYHFDSAFLNQKYASEQKNITFIKYIGKKEFTDSGYKSNDIQFCIQEIKEAIEEYKNIQNDNYVSERKYESIVDLMNAINSFASDSVVMHPKPALFLVVPDIKESTKESLKAEIDSAKRRKNYDELDYVIFTESEVLNNLSTSSNGFYVERGSVMIDEDDNYLKFKTSNERIDESIICNVSAKSIKELWDKHKNDLLGLNLRFHVSNKKVDDKITNSILQQSDTFWFKNNGLVIICEKYKVVKDKVKLENFSIVNGGQTTYNIGQSSFDKDFFVACKIIQIKNLNKATQDGAIFEFANEIAEATNSQKKISNTDLIANNIKLKHTKGVFEGDLVNPIFLETRRGQFKYASAETKEKFKSPTKRIQAEKLIQIHASFWNITPGTSRNQKSSLMDNSKKVSTAFEIISQHANIYKELTVLFHAINEAKKSKNINKETNKNILFYKEYMSYCTFFIFALIKMIYICNHLCNEGRQSELFTLRNILQDQNTSKKTQEEIEEWITRYFNEVKLPGNLLNVDISENNADKKIQKIYESVVKNGLLGIYINSFERFKNFKGGLGQPSNYGKLNKDFYEFFLSSFINSVYDRGSIHNSFFELFNLPKKGQ